jgi:hypothetical protein
MNGLDEFPVSAQQFKDGELSAYLLPLRGYTVEELHALEEEKRELQAKREKEEMERRAQGENDRIVRLAAEAMIPALFNEQKTEPAKKMEKYVTLYDDKGSKMTNMRGTLPFSLANIVNELSFSQNANATSLQQELVPVGTAPASTYVAGIPASETVKELAASKKAKMKESIKSGAQFNGQIGGDPPQRGNNTLDSRQDLPTRHQIVTNDKNPPLSLILEEDEKRDLEVEHQDGVQQVRELNEVSERIEAEEILNGAAGTGKIYRELASENRSQYVTSKHGDSSIDHDQPDGIVDMSPAELSELPPDDPGVPDCENESTPPKQKPFALADFDKQVQDILDAEREEMLETEAILNAPPGAHSIEALQRNEGAGPMAVNSTSADDFTILAIDSLQNETEMIETEAILNAPPGADGIELPNKNDSAGSVCNITALDDLSILEMDTPQPESTAPLHKEAEETMKIEGSVEDPSGVTDGFERGAELDFVSERVKLAALLSQDGRAGPLPDPNGTEDRDKAPSNS